MAVLNNIINMKSKTSDGKKRVLKDVNEKNENKKEVVRENEKLKSEKSHEVFYLEEIISKKRSQCENQRNNSILQTKRICEKEELKDKQYIDSLKEDLLNRYKKEQLKCQKKIEDIRKKAQAKIEASMRDEERKVEELCRREVIIAIENFAKANSWFKVATRLYKEIPEIFDKNNRK